MANPPFLSGLVRRGRRLRPEPALRRGIKLGAFSTTRQRFNLEIGAVSSIVTASPTLKAPASSCA